MTKEEFIKKVFAKTEKPIFLKEYHFNTIFEGEDLKRCMMKFISLSPATYYKNGRTQCYSYRNRSVGDLYRVMRLKFDVSREDFLDALVDLIASKKMGAFYCTDVRKIVLSRSFAGVHDPYRSFPSIRYLQELVKARKIEKSSSR